MNPKSNDQNKESSNDEFYQELDQKKLHQSCCTCHTLVILFGFFLIIVSGSIFYLYWQVTHGGMLRSGNNKSVTIKDFDNKLNNVAVEDNIFTLSLTADELNSVLTKGLSVDDFILKDIVTSINPSEVLIYGNLVKPLNAKVMITCLPTAAGGKIKLQVTKISAGSVNLPAILNRKVSDNITTLLDRKFENFYKKNTVEQVSLNQDTILVSGKIK